MQRRDFSALAALLALAPLARAQTWPAKPINWLIPFPPGGVTDTSARTLGKRLGELLGQQVLIDNRPGAGGSLGTEQAARAPATATPGSTARRARWQPTWRCTRT